MEHPITPVTPVASTTPSSTRLRIRPPVSGRFNSLRVRLFLFVALLVIPAALLVLFSAAYQRTRDALDAKQEAMRLAGLVASYQEQQIEASRQLLLALAQLPAVQQLDGEVCSAQLAALLTRYPNYTNFSVTNLRGETFCSANPVPEGMNSRGVAWFDRVLRYNTFAMGDYMIGRISNKPIVVMAHPVQDESGVTHAIMALGMNLDWLSAWLGRVELPEATTLKVIDSQGTILASFPVRDNEIGTALAEDGLRQAVFNPGMLNVSAGQGFYENGDYLYGYTPAGDAPGRLNVVVQMERARVMRDADQLQAQYLTGLGIFALVVMVVGWFGAGILVIQPIDKLIRTTESLAEGHWEARAQLPNSTQELDRLATTFNHLAVSLQHRDHQLKRSLNDLESEIDERKRVAKALQETINALEEARAAQHKAQQADESKLRFMAMITHELKTPLTSVKGFATTLLADDVEWDPESQQNFIHIISEEADTLLEMVDQLLDFAQIEAGTLRINRIPATLNAVVDMAKPRFRALTSNHDLQLKIPPYLPVMQLDPRRMAQVLVNLISNASKYSAQGSPIILSIRQRDDYILIEVQDFGCGITGEMQSRLFQPFSRAPEVRAGGTGVGLAICKGIVEAHGGHIWVYESVVGKGTTMAVMLPLGA
ncbi:MAG: ATP-binding protein [bacterium]|nr:ATP-binding protein [bacterium]